MSSNQDTRIAVMIPHGTIVRLRDDYRAIGQIVEIIPEGTSAMQRALYKVRWDGVTAGSGGTTLQARPTLEYKINGRWERWDGAIINWGRE